MRLPGGLDAARGPDPGVVAAAVVAARRRLTVIPARVRRIDRALQGMGVDWSAPPLARLDPGLAAEQPGRNGLMFTAVQAMLTGGAGTDMASIGSFARSLAPAGGAAPLAGQIQYPWPVRRGREPPRPPADQDTIPPPHNHDPRQPMPGLA